MSPAGGLDGVVYAIETLAALASAWLRCSTELRGLRQRVDQLARAAEQRERECAELRHQIADARGRLRASGCSP